MYTNGESLRTQFGVKLKEEKTKITRIKTILGGAGIRIGSPSGQGIRIRHKKVKNLEI